MLYQHGTDLVRGDLLASDGPAAGQRVVTGWPGMALSVYPDDPDLPTLPMAITASVMGPQVATALASLAPIQRRAFSRRCRVTLLRYRLGKRATVRFGTPVFEASYVAKVYHDPAKAAAVAQEAQSLAGSPQPRRRPPVGAHRRSPARNLSRRAAVDLGQPLDSLLQATGTAGAAAAEAVRLAASALAQLHRGPMVSTRLRPVEKELHRFREPRVAHLCRRLPAGRSVAGRG